MTHDFLASSQALSPVPELTALLFLARTQKNIFIQHSFTPELHVMIALCNVCKLTWSFSAENSASDPPRHPSLPYFHLQGFKCRLTSGGVGGLKS